MRHIITTLFYYICICYLVMHQLCLQVITGGVLVVGKYVNKYLNLCTNTL